MYSLQKEIIAVQWRNALKRGERERITRINKKEGGKMRRHRGVVVMARVSYSSHCCLALLAQRKKSSGGSSLSLPFSYPLTPSTLYLYRSIVLLLAVVVVVDGVVASCHCSHPNPLTPRPLS